MQCACFYKRKICAARYDGACLPCKGRICPAENDRTAAEHIRKITRKHYRGLIKGGNNRRTARQGRRIPSEPRCVGILGRRDTSAYGGESRPGVVSRLQAEQMRTRGRMPHAADVGEARHDNQRLSRPCIDCRSPRFVRDRRFSNLKSYIIYAPCGGAQIHRKELPFGSGIRK